MASKELPFDIIFEILTRTTSLETLDSCELVCETWKNLTRETSFMPLYCQRTKNFSGFFLQDIKDHKYLSMFVSFDQSNVCMERLPDDMQILASCNQGILCCVKPQSKNNYRYYACKPATKQWQSLPNPKLRYESAAVAIMVLSSSPLRYKIVRLSHRGIIGSTSTYKFEIFDSRIWRWKETQEVKLPYDELICSSSTSVSISNSIYWLTSHDNVLAFHEHEGTFQKLPLPQEVFKDNNKKLVEYEGKLGLICKKKDGEMELWTMNENPRNCKNWTMNQNPRNCMNWTMNENPRNCTNWRKKMIMDIKRLVRDVTHPSVAGFYNDGIAFLQAFYEVVFYKLEECSCRRVKVDYDLRYAREIFQFRSDLEPVKLGRF